MIPELCRGGSRERKRMSNRVREGGERRRHIERERARERERETSKRDQDRADVEQQRYMTNTDHERAHEVQHAGGGHTWGAYSQTQVQHPPELLELLPLSSTWLCSGREDGGEKQREG